MKKRFITSTACFLQFLTVTLTATMLMAMFRRMEIESVALKKISSHFTTVTGCNRELL